MAKPTPAVPKGRTHIAMPRFPQLEMRGILATLSTALFGAAMLGAKIGVTIDPDMKGAIILQWGGVMSWYFGSSKGSAAKDTTIASQAKAIAATPPADSQ